MEITVEPGRFAFHDLRRGARRVAALALSALALSAAGAASGEESGGDPPYAPGVDPPALQTRVPPLYPDDARRDGIAGVVLVSARVGRDGRVRDARITCSIPALDEAALAAVRRYEFLPAHRDGLECESWALAPVRFGEFLPRGGRAPQAEPAADGDEKRAFQADVAAVRDQDPADAEESGRRERIMSESLALDVIPPPGDDALEAFARGDTCGYRGTLQGHAEARSEWTRAAQLAPWWPAPYRRLAAALLADRDYAGAERCARIALAGRPGEVEAEALFRRATEARLGVASVNLHRNKK